MHKLTVNSLSAVRDSVSFHNIQHLLIISCMQVQHLTGVRLLSVLLRDNGKAKDIDLCSACLMVFAAAGDTQALLSKHSSSL